MKSYTGRELLLLPMPKHNDADVKTLGAYLVKLASQVWDHQEGFNGKRPFGNSGWWLDVVMVLVQAEAVEGVIDADEELEDFDRAQVEQRVAEMFAELETFVGA